MSIQLIALVLLVVLACTVAGVVVILNRERRAVLSRADGRLVHETPVAILRRPEETFAARVASWLRDRTPASWSEAGEATDVLVHAGWDGPMAPLFYATLRLATIVILPLAAIVLVPRHLPQLILAGAALGAITGFILPRAAVDRVAARRRDRLRRSLPDCLDLLVVCVEAGVSLDAAMLRVARDMQLAHPELSGELLVVNRKMNAGLTRDEAVGGLWKRTGVEELRALSSSIVQSERLGTSIARVLRVYSETLRRKRRQAAEKRAAEAALKMIIPLGLFMLPALFALILGPASMRAKAIFEALGQR
ncbi:MAG TPA: type II secretion system F family protein [Gemmatimonadaceae bacterium]|nr:type II secretion system F family protein [Gemmatimonadaceae bacterium]